MPPGASPEDVGDAAVVAGLIFTMQAARIRRPQAGQGRRELAPPELALDIGPSPHRRTGTTGIYTKVQMMCSGGEGVDMATIGAFAGAVAPQERWVGRLNSAG
jgi:hypothetical protein